MFKHIGMIIAAGLLSFVGQAWAEESFPIPKPRPVIEVAATGEEVFNPGGFWVDVHVVGLEAEYRAMLDTGAVQTVLPIEFIAVINGARQVGDDFPLFSANGAEMRASVFLLPHLVVDGCVVDNVEVLGVAGAFLNVLVIGTPTLELMGVSFSMKDRQAGFVCATSGKAHVVVSPNGRRLQNAAGSQ